MRPHVLALIIWLLASADTSMAGPIIFDNGGPGRTFASSVGLSVLANDFVLPKTTALGGFHFWTIETLGAWDGTLQYFLFDDAGGQPTAAPFATGAGQDIMRAPTGAVVQGLLEFEYSARLETPVLLIGGTRYWFGLHMQSDFESLGCCFWESVFPAPGFGLVSFASEGGTFDNWTNGEGDEHAFQLISAVPGPGSVLLLGPAIIWLVVWSVVGKRRRARI